MSEERCRHCFKAVSEEDLDYGWCTDCIDEVTHDTDLMLKYISDRKNNILGESLEHDFFVNYCHNADDREYSRELTLLCKKHILFELSLGNFNTEQMLIDFVNEDLTNYLDWVEKNKNREQISADRKFKEAIAEAVYSVYLSDESKKELFATIKRLTEERTSK